MLIAILLPYLLQADSTIGANNILIWRSLGGIGPATALKLYDKGHRTLDDLRNDDSLTNAQKSGLKYFDDIRHRIPCHEVCGVLPVICYYFPKIITPFYFAKNH